MVEGHVRVIPASVAACLPFLTAGSLCNRSSPTCAGGCRHNANFTRRQDMVHESSQVQKPLVETKSLLPCRVTRSRAAMMRQALLVRLRWSLHFGPCVGLGEGGRRRCILANHGWRVPGSTGCGKQGSHVSALDGSAQCFTICTSLRASH